MIQNQYDRYPLLVVPHIVNRMTMINLIRTSSESGAKLKNQVSRRVFPKANVNEVVLS